MADRASTEQSIFLQALDIDAAERAAWLDRACGGDDQLKAQVEALLRASAQEGDLLDLPEAGAGRAGAYAPTMDMPGKVAEAPGTVIGPYKLLQQIGEGGMGTVYMAEQTRPVHRKVALKVVKAGMDSRQVIARFEAER
ncbi:MAG TPA: hypothetical protein VML55_26975, partial [Planctomycetaceae bacterium]|nr:hypothetical protein [Planctomycetaceae bacterium]